MAGGSRSRLGRLVGLLGLTGDLLRARLTRTGTRRLLLSVCGVALAVAIVVVVAGISVGLAGQGTVVNANVDYWIVPEGGDTSTLPVSVSGPQFGNAHAVGERLTSDPRIQYASPVAVSLLRVDHANTTEYVLAAGVVAHPGLRIAGVDTTGLTPGDPYYANGTYNGTWTGEAVVSDAAADLLNASAGDTLTARTAGRSASFEVVARSAGGDTGAGTIPVLVVHLAEYQELAGGTTQDTADQFLVATDDASVREDLGTVYPNARVITRGGGSLSGVANSQLALAIAVAGLLVALVVGTLFVATAMGLEITADRRLWATLLALGFSRRSRALLVAGQTLAITLVGGVLGIGVGWLGIHATNLAVTHVLPVSVLAVFHPLFGVYALAMAGLIGLCSVPYLLWLTARGDPTDHLTT